MTTQNPAALIQEKVSEHAEAKASHTQSMQKLNELTNAISNCEKERQNALEQGKEAETNWRERFRSLRGVMTDELKIEHSQRIAQRELAQEFSGLIEELDIDRQQAMLQCCRTGREYVNAHRAAFVVYADDQWKSALKCLSPTLLRAMKLRALALELDEAGMRDQHGYVEPELRVSREIGEILTGVARAMSVDMKAEPVLSELGLHRPALTGVDMTLYRSPMSMTKLGQALREKREKLNRKEG